MRGLGLREGIPAALKADTLPLTAFEVGLFGWMALVQLAFSRRAPCTRTRMQIGMILGFLTAFPVNWWLLKRNIKEPM